MLEPHDWITLTPPTAAMGIGSVLVTLITLYQGLIILRAIISWFVSPYTSHALLDLLRRLTDPVLEPVRDLLPVSGGIDLSPLIVLIALELIKRFIA